MARVTIGGTEYEVPEMNFAALERAWPFVEESMITMDPMKSVKAGICIVAAGLLEADHFKKTDFGIEEDENLGETQTFDRMVLFFKKKLKATEISGVRAAVDQINKEAGLDADEGEALPVPQASPGNPSEEIAPSSQQSSSLPDMKEAAGI
jgi:hypothetical protein